MAIARTNFPELDKKTDDEFREFVEKGIFENEALKVNQNESLWGKGLFDFVVFYDPNTGFRQIWSKNEKRVVECITVSGILFHWDSLGHQNLYWEGAVIPAAKIFVSATPTSLKFNDRDWHDANEGNFAFPFYLAFWKVGSSDAPARRKCQSGS